MVHGYNHLAGYLINKLGLRPADFGRFRDAGLYENPEKKGEHQIRVLTRNGGGNRPDYQMINENLAKHPLYIKDEDDSYDSTYAYFYFKVPEEVLKDLADHEIAIEEVVDNKTLKEKFDRAISILR